MSKPPALEPGIYTTQEGRTAIAYRVARANVYIVTMLNGQIEHRHMHHADFLRLFTRHLPAYPVRRAARIYLDSQLLKDETAVRALRALLHS